MPRLLFLVPTLAAALAGCRHAPPEAAPSTTGSPTALPAEPAPRPRRAPPTPTRRPPPAAPAAPPRLPPPAAAVTGGDTRVLTTSWRAPHNEGVDFLARGDARAALAAGLRALALAPANARSAPLLLVATAASGAGDADLATEAVRELLATPEAAWEIFYNGSLDAAQAGRPADAGRFAREALDRGGDPALVGPLALRLTLAEGDLRAATRIADRLGDALPAELAGTLAAALARAATCVPPGTPADPCAPAAPDTAPPPPPAPPRPLTGAAVRAAATGAPASPAAGSPASPPPGDAPPAAPPR